MGNASALPERVKGLHALDPDLPFLASEAAVDLDNLLSDRSRELTAIRQLAEQLKNSISLSMPSQPRALMDPATLTIVGDAMLQVVEEKRDSKIENLLALAAVMAEHLLSDDPAKNRKGLEQARDFCVALSRAATIYRKSILDLRPQHPFRR
ncbi:MAG: hypothetical protein C4576_11115 [Desulfobacteraceae bacterium]|jgi:hypothetical protein|nr:MAG: hypothetical protein C4576_11115 [Desulfobacteraceae bacterium]